MSTRTKTSIELVIYAVGSACGWLTFAMALNGNQPIYLVLGPIAGVYGLAQAKARWGRL